MILMIQRITASLLVVAALSSCEVPIEVDLPHTERLVVDGFIGLSPDQSELRVVRTLAPLARVDVTKMIISDVTATIEWKGTVYPLTRNIDSVTFALPQESTTWEDGTARLTVKGAGKTTAALTRIPKRPVILSTRVVDSISDYGSQVTYVFADIEVDTGTVVWSTDQYDSYYTNERPLYHYGFKDIAPGGGTTGRVKIRTMAWSQSYSVPDSVELTFYSADPVWDRYLRSPYGDGGGLFGFSGTNPYFNLSGDGIGLFIGVSSAKVGVRLR